MKNAPQVKSELFLRPSSGLVKSAGLVDVFIFDVGLISIGIGIAYSQRFGSAYYSSGSISLATIMAAILMALVSLGLWTWTSTIPRSGGIYVFLTRSHLAGIGFALSFVECVSWLFYAAIAATLLVSAGFWPLAALVLGPNSVIAEWLTSPLAKLLIGSTAIWFAVFLLIRGTRIYFRVQKIMFFCGLVGTLTLLYVLGSQGAAQTFTSNVNATFGNGSPETYNEILRQAETLGRPPSTGATAEQTIALLVWPFLPLIGAAFSFVLGGETQHNTRNQLLGMLGSLVFCAAVFVVVAYLSNWAIPTEFQGAIAYVFDNGKDSIKNVTIPGEPYLPFLAGLATNRLELRILIVIGFIAWIWFWIPGVLAYTERVFLAWGLDRVAPSLIAKLHPVWATPYVAVITGALVAEAFLVLVSYTDFFATLVFILAGAVAWCIALAIGVFFPFLSPDIYSFSPLRRYNMLGLPLMTVLCATGAIALACVVYLLWNDPVAAGHSPKSLGAIFLTFAVGFIFYSVVQRIRKRQGIDISRALREIPVE
jgi:amino acid transporter